MRLYRYCCGCIGFKHEAERVHSNDNAVVGDALLIQTCEDGEYTLSLRVVDVHRPFVDKNEKDHHVRELTPEITEHHLSVLRGYVSMGYDLERVRRILTG